MTAASTIMVESHRSAATLYAIGVLTTAAVLRLIAHAYQLPDHVRALRIDLRGVRQADPHAMRALELGLSPWRACRRGMSRVTLPDHLDTGLSGLRFAHRRWSPGMGDTSGGRAPTRSEFATAARPS